MFVLQDWVKDVGLKMQSILLSGLRAPDQKTESVKKCVRWMRGVSQRNADPSKQSYMEDIVMSNILADRAIDELEYCIVHYVHHFADAMAVIAYHHPDEKVKEFAYYIHYKIAEELFHFQPETEKQFRERHRDKR